SSSACVSSTMSCALSALRASGRLSLTSPTRSFCSTMMVVNCIAASSQAGVARSALADRTVERRASALCPAPYGAPARGPQARLAFATVDQQRVLKRPSASVCSLVVAHARAPGANRLREYQLHRCHQPLGGRTRPPAAGCEAPRGLEGIKTGAKQGLAGVDV